ncbi:MULTISPECIES: ubiquinone biosynthesis regulatory protein kinase UbiB [unclassified Vibrio]|uniref:ubiquinone biosynthesis regulatory protein kinase UbiB n=1 Tax=unclassified Vibrio TaxID=2614977 RepID=UPI00148323B9|nr:MULTISPECIES: ubiquinone biosynthesis regulatory protein kinase UbiB [unclassified Vibrio]MDQ2193998.1 ubiquinone biosynthesis regulatory protein kinase UbiB [Vibrio sp. A14(2019)]MDQ2198243.1 ubiquinone biosynthesis regulatory protein kinase UbiB [Vibrio sp. 2017_1457_11]NNN77439.1 ubiquinone biosynthesis regulatory protein kinase UbiB [Vibrio sp. B7]NNN94228.1 ubiquinone biosynthesis regulatory protein kinase UbiB [Vibrio sp. B8-1]NNO09308.1 ubiquinone biosynthesis regulatory protein kina
MTPTELKRLYRIIKVQLEYGLDELLPEHQLTKAPILACKGLFWIKNQHANKPLGERLRLALQELGPVWIKFGQMMSTRRDLFPPHIADQLALLQDKVAPFDGVLAKTQMEKALGGALETWFDEFDIEPLASASIAQVHTAKLKSSGREIVLKVIRPDIRPVIDADIKLMYRMAKIVAKALPEARRLKPVEVVREYEKTLLAELDLRREAANAIQLRRNFDNSEELYIPEIIPDFSNETVMVSERIYGIQVSDIEGLAANGTNMKLLAERGVSVFFTQVFRDSFFHADMHPGNVFVNPAHPDNPQWIGLDCGIVGTLNSEDKRYLAENFLAFFNRDYRRVAQLHVDSGWVPRETNIDEFEFAIRVVCEPIFAKPLCEISFGHVLLNLFNTARRFNMEVQPQLVLLQKTLLYVEGLGRQLYPQLDLWQTAKPFLEKWMMNQVGPQAFIRAVKERAPLWAEKLPELPELLYDSLKQGKAMNQRLDQLYQGYRASKRQQATGKFLFGIGATLVVCSAILVTSAYQPFAITSAIVGVVFWLLSWSAYRR